MMSGVSWPTDWSRAYFTPVTVLAGRALLGKTFCSVRTGVIRDVELAEYCNKQVLTFDWPQGAAVVVECDVPVHPRAVEALPRRRRRLEGRVAGGDAGGVDALHLGPVRGLERDDPHAPRDESSASTRPRISSRIGRTASIPCP